MGGPITEGAMAARLGGRLAAGGAFIEAKEMPSTSEPHRAELLTVVKVVR